MMIRVRTLFATLISLACGGTGFLCGLYVGFIASGLFVREGRAGYAPGDGETIFVIVAISGIVLGTVCALSAWRRTKPWRTSQQ